MYINNIETFLKNKMTTFFYIKDFLYTADYKKFMPKPNTTDLGGKKWKDYKEIRVATHIRFGMLKYLQGKFQVSFS